MESPTTTTTSKQIIIEDNEDELVFVRDYDKTHADEEAATDDETESEGEMDAGKENTDPACSKVKATNVEDVVFFGPLSIEERIATHRIGGRRRVTLVDPSTPAPLSTATRVKDPLAITPTDSELLELGASDVTEDAPDMLASVPEDAVMEPVTERADDEQKTLVDAEQVQEATTDTDDNVADDADEIVVEPKSEAEAEAVAEAVAEAEAEAEAVAPEDKEVIETESIEEKVEDAVAEELTGSPMLEVTPEAASAPEEPAVSPFKEASKALESAFDEVLVLHQQRLELRTSLEEAKKTMTAVVDSFVERMHQRADEEKETEERKQMSREVTERMARQYVARQAKEEKEHMERQSKEKIELVLKKKFQHVVLNQEREAAVASVVRSLLARSQEELRKMRTESREATLLALLEEHHERQQAMKTSFMAAVTVLQAVARRFLASRQLQRLKLAAIEQAKSEEHKQHVLSVMNRVAEQLQARVQLEAKQHERQQQVAVMEQMVTSFLGQIAKRKAADQAAKAAAEAEAARIAAEEAARVAAEAEAAKAAEEEAARIAAEEEAARIAAEAEAEAARIAAEEEAAKVAAEEEAARVAAEAEAARIAAEAAAAKAAEEEATRLAALKKEKALKEAEEIAAKRKADIDSAKARVENLRKQREAAKERKQAEIEKELQTFSEKGGSMLRANSASTISEASETKTAKPKKKSGLSLREQTEQKLAHLRENRQRRLEAATAALSGAGAALQGAEQLKEKTTDWTKKVDELTAKRANGPSSAQKSQLEQKKRRLEEIRKERLQLQEKLRQTNDVQASEPKAMADISNRLRTPGKPNEKTSTIKWADSTPTNSHPLLQPSPDRLHSPDLAAASTSSILKRAATKK